MKIADVHANKRQYARGSETDVWYWMEIPCQFQPLNYNFFHNWNENKAEEPFCLHLIFRNFILKTICNSLGNDDFKNFSSFMDFRLFSLHSIGAQNSHCIWIRQHHSHWHCALIKHRQIFYEEAIYAIGILVAFHSLSAAHFNLLFNILANGHCFAFWIRLLCFLQFSNILLSTITGKIKKSCE